MRGRNYRCGLPALTLLLLAALPVTTRAQTPQTQRRVDPMLRAALARHTLGPVALPGRAELTRLDRARGLEPAPGGGDEAWIRVLVKGSGVATSVRALGGVVGTELGPVATARLPLSALYALAEAPGIEFIEASTPHKAMLDSALIGANVLPLHGAGYNLKGSGVLVGIYDSGIDYTHGDFITSGGTSRILSLWDQTVNDVSRYPSPFTYGSEWTQAELNDEIDGFPAYLVTELDINGHGTHVAGIAAGNGLAAGKYPGVAPEADLIIIKGGDGNFSSVDIVDGIAYFFARADALARPGVINLSLGGHSGPHDGTSAYETAIDNAIGTGKVVVVSAGNEANDNIHDRRSLTVPGAKDSFQVTIDSYTPNSGTGNDYLLFNIWYEGSTSVSITFVAPGGTRYGPYASGTLDGAPTSTNGYIYCDNAQFGTESNGDKHIYVEIYDSVESWEPAAGTWKVVFELASGTATAVDTWLPDMSFTAYMTSGTPDYSVGHPGTAIGAITVGAWVTNRIWDAIDAGTYYYPNSNNPGDIANFSSWGPTRDGRQKPDLAAPGQGIFSAMSDQMITYPDDSWIDPDGVHRLSQGTSQAAPVVTGAVALLLQADPTLTADQIKQYLRDTASTDSYTGSVPSNEWGYGKLDAQAAVDAVLATTGTPPTIAIYQPTGTQHGPVTVSYHIEDTDLSSVDLTVEYSDDHGESWYAATTTGLTTGISAAEYDSAFVWVSDGDLFPFSCSQVWLRVTPSDATAGTADITKFPLDNQEPMEVCADGIEGENIINFWFDEPVDIPIATNTGNYNLSGGLTAASIAAVEEAWAVDPLPVALRGPGSAVIDGEAWVVGGFDGSDYLSSLYRYNDNIGAWEQRADMPTPREAMVVAEIDGLLYVAGGETGPGSFTHVLEIYDPDTDTWTTGHGLNNPRSWAAYGVIEGRLYVSGGMSSTGALTNGEVYDPATDNWFGIAAHPEAKQKAAFGVIDRKLYVAGGAAPPGTMYTSLHVYDPETDSWTALTDMNPHRHSAASGVVQGRLYVAGGLDSANQPRTEIFWYWPAASSWEAASVTLDAARDGARGLSLDERLYVAGGYCDGTLTTEVTEFDPSACYELTLGAGQTLPAVGITLEAIGIEDRFGNVSSYLTTDFTPTTVTPPSVIVRQPEGTRSGDVPIHFIISDPEGDAVDLLVEYSTDGSSWQTATVADPGGLCCIESVDYDNWTVWASGDDLPEQEWATVWIRITPSDATGDGASDQTTFPLDNQPPQSLLGHGEPGDRTKIRFWYDEPVDPVLARQKANYSISEGLTIQSILRRDSWEEVTEAVAPTARVGAATAVIGNKVYVAGGQDAGANKLDLLEIYDTDTQSWSTGATMPGARAGAAGGVIDGKWYLAGGAGPSGSLNTVVVYDPTSDIWSSGLETMSLARAGCRGAVVDGLLYVMGGDALTQTAVEVYDPKGDTWTTRSSYSVPRGGAVVGVIQGFIYLAGGYDNANLRSELEVYDPQNDLWSTLAPMPEARNNAAGGALGYQLVVAGGQGFGEYKSETYLYNPSTDQWFPALSMPEARSAANSIIDDERLYVAGGFNTGGTMLTSILEYDPQAWYVAQLAPGESLPDNSVTLEAADIPDLYSNSQLSISTDILPYELSAHISGTAYDVNPDPIEGMRLLLRPTGQAWIDTTYTDADGEYWFDMAPGTYEVHGQKIHGLNYYETAWYDSIQVELGHTVVHDLDITRGPTFGVASVNINGTGTTSATVNTGDAVAVTMDYAAWNDAITPLSNEWLTLGLGSSGYAGYSLGTTSVYPGDNGTATFNFTAPTTGGIYTVYVKRAASTTEVGALLRYNARFWNVDWEYIPVGILTVIADGTIAGTVYEPDTTIPIPNAKVRLRPHLSTVWSDSTVTGSDGAYSFAVSAGADYNVFVEALSGGRYVSNKPEDVVTSLIGTHDPPMATGYGFALESLALSVTGSDSAFMQPGGSITGTLRLRTWDSWTTESDVHLLIGIGSGAQDLDYRVVSTPGNYTGTSGDIVLDLQAPGTSGTYSIYVVLDRDGTPTSDDYEDRFPFDAAYAFLPVGTVIVDGTAPTPATGVDMGDSGSSTSAWTNDSAGMRVRFNVPADPSGISGVRYKLVPAGETDEPPQDETQITDSALAQYDSGNGKWYFDLVLTGRVADGANHLYFWLVDGAYNYSYTQWAEGWVAFDADDPSEPILLTPDSGATVTVQRPTFTWTASDDAGLSGIDHYVVRVGTNSSLGEIVHEGEVNSITFSYTVTEDIPNSSYFWAVHAVDAVGNQSSWTARPITVSAATLDQPVLVSVTGGDWSNQDVTPLSWNAVSGAAQYTLQLTIGTDTGFAAFFYENTTTSTSMGVGVGGHGDGEYRWRVRAEAGLDFSPWSETTFRLDRTAPSLTVEALPTLISTGQAITITAHAGDANGLQFVRLFHRESGVSSGFTQVNMSATGGDAYQGQIPGTVVGVNGFQYYLLARDTAGNDSRADASGGLGGDETGGAEISLPNMPASATLPRDRWQMVSVPHVPDNAGVSALLTNIPAYDEKVWRFFRWTGSAYQEVSSASLQPGRGYWLYHRRDGVQLDPGSGHTIPSGRPFEITLTPGWNDIGSPWLFNVPWTVILSESGLTDTDVTRPYGYDGTDWVLPPNIGELPVWYGVSVYNRGSSNLTLKVPPLAAGGQLVAEAKTLAEVMADQGLTAQLPVGRVEEDGVSGWRLQFLLSQEGAKTGDVQNYVGVLTGHTEGWDPDDLPDPPMPIEGSARAMVDRTRRAQDRGWYATDYQGPGEPGWEWPLRVESVQGGRRVTLTFQGLTGLPDGVQAALVDVRSNLRIDLAEGSSYRFFPGVNAGQTPREGMTVDHTLRLVVGSTSFVDARTAGTIRLPAEAGLDQNYPNPFNPTTTIRFALAEPSRVRITVLNVRGQQVAVLADGLYNAGPHTLQWDGRDATGRPAASGIYFCRLEAAGKVLSKKMTLIR